MTGILEELSVSCDNPSFISQLEQGLTTDGPWTKMQDERARINSYLRYQIGTHIDDNEGVREHLTEEDHPVAWSNAIKRYIMPLINMEGWNGKEPQSR